MYLCDIITTTSKVVFQDLNAAKAAEITYISNPLGPSLIMPSSLSSETDPRMTRLLSLCGSDPAKLAVKRLINAIREGVRQDAIQLQPNILILQRDYYSSILVRELSVIAWLWLEACGDLFLGGEVQAWQDRQTRAAEGGGGGDRPSSSSREIELLSMSPGAPAAQLIHFIRTPLSSSLASQDNEIFSAVEMNNNLTPTSIAAVHLAQLLVTSVLPHSLSKQNSVNYGLLNLDDAGLYCRDTQRNEPLSRRLLAVPYLGKDSPSPAAEFSNLDVCVVKTCLAFTYTGLRYSDTRRLLISLKREFNEGFGAPSSRSAWIMFSSFLAAAKTSGNAVAAKAAGLIEPLELIQPSNRIQVQHVRAAIGFLPQAIQYFLDAVFEETKGSFTAQLTASGHDLGASYIFLFIFLFAFLRLCPSLSIASNFVFVYIFAFFLDRL